MAQQTFIIRLEKADGSIVDFERWADKRAQTCINKMIKLYKVYSGLYMRNLDQAAKVVCYPTPDGYHAEDPVWSVSADEFKKLVKES